MNSNTKTPMQASIASWLKDPFFTVPLQPVTTSEGDVNLPLLYFDASNLTALFRADDKEVLRQLQGTGLEPALYVAGKPVVGVSCYEYRATSVGVYNEVGLAILVCPKGKRKPLQGWFDLFRKADERELGAYILDLPVTTAAANAAGQEIWGYPKFVTPISFNMTKDAFTCRVDHPNTKDSIMTLSGRTRMLFPWKSMDVALFSFKGGQALRTHVNVRGGNYLRLTGTLTLTVGSSDHVMAKNIKALGLNGATPLAVMSTNRFQSRLNAGAPVQLPK
jgi:hypothetical protein